MPETNPIQLSDVVVPTVCTCRPVVEQQSWRFFIYYLGLHCDLSVLDSWIGLSLQTHLDFKNENQKVVLSSSRFLHCPIIKISTGPRGEGGRERGKGYRIMNKTHSMIR